MPLETYKAYSLLSEKQFDENDTIIRGWATTVTPDRIDDVVVPDGVVFRTDDVKLLMHHDHRLPVGTVKFGKPTKKGLPFEARLPDVKEEGLVRDRVREAIHSIRYNLISAVSIGFRALQGGVEVMKNGGLKFNSWEMIELSLTPTPMQPEAVFAAVKSFNQDGRLPRDVIDAIKAHDANLPEKLNGGYVIRPVRQEIKTLRNPDGSFRLRGQ
jgi:HK97 family phage prohead protease